MLNWKKQREDELVGYKFKANEIPKTTSEPLYEKIMEENEQRRQDVKAKSKEIT